MFKRCFDCCLSLAGLVVLGSVLLLIAVAIKLTSPGPVFYRGRRAGRGGKPFRIFKFRTMVVNAEKIGGPSTSDDDCRITPVGKTLRKFKLDELPQLLNVLSGEMSLVGPRPEVQQYVDMYTEEEKAILNMRPGITDWASIWNSDEGAVLAGRDDPDKAYEELIRPTKLELQLAYARKHSLWIDVKIILFTLFKLVNSNVVPREVREVLKQTNTPDLKALTKGNESDHGYSTVTELPGHGATPEQFSMLQTRYRMGRRLTKGKDVLELACGPGVGLGCLGRTARRVVGGDYDPALVEAAVKHYGSRFEIRQLDAQDLPFEENSFDVILLLEAIYYLPEPARFVAEACRVLRKDGVVFICSANRERPDFNASPFTCKYFSASELYALLTDSGFDVEIFGGYPVGDHGLKGRILGVVRDVAVKLHLIPRTMKWKIWLKRLLFGKLTPIPAELEVDDAQCEELIPIQSSQEVSDYKVIYAVGRRAA